MVDAAIVIPGIMGSELYKNGRMIWPGSLTELLLPYDKMDDLLDPDLEVREIIGAFSVSKQYDSLLDTLEKCGLTRVGPRPTLVTCPYDWRKDNALAAQRLADKVGLLSTLHGSDVKINLVAHSMGGLVARYFLESGTYNDGNCEGFANVRSLITIGTPHRGAPLALAAALGHIKRLFLNASQVKTLANTNGFSALYQLLPNADEPFVWDSSLSSRLEPMSVYDNQNLGLSTQNLASAAAFHKGLDHNRKPKQVRYFCFVGTRQETPSYARGDFGKNPPSPKTVSVMDGGDGTVPSWSASIPGMQQLAVGGDHGALYKTPEVRTTLGELFGKRVLWEDAWKFRLSVREEVAEPHTQLNVVIFSNGLTPTVDADLVVRKLAAADSQPLATPTEIARYRINYSGLPLESLALKVQSPDYAGIYVIQLERGRVNLADDGATFCVQRP